MNHLIVGLTSLFPALGIAASPGLAAGEDDKAAVAQVLKDYYNAFSGACSKLDVQAIFPYFHEPTLLMGLQGVAVAPTHGSLVALITPAMGPPGNRVWPQRIDQSANQAAECHHHIGERRCCPP